MRKYITSIRLTEEMRAMARHLQDLEDRNFSNLMARLIKQEYDRRQQPHTMTDEAVGHSIGEPATEEA